MRKDVKLGLAVGGLLFILVVLYYAASNPNEKKPTVASTQNPAPSDNHRQNTTPPANNTLTPSNNVATHAPSGGASTGNTETGNGNTSDNTDWPTLFRYGETSSTPHTDRITVTPGGGVATPAPGPSHETVASGNTGNTATDTPGGGDSTPATQPAPANLRTHVVKRGESYWTIARDVYGNGSFAGLLEKANPKYPHDRLREGVTIVLPELTDLARGTVPQPISHEERIAPATEPAATGETYQVQSGDTLWKISMKLYGNSQQVSALYDLNKDQIGADPSRLKLHMVLKLPQQPTQRP